MPELMPLIRAWMLHWHASLRARLPILIGGILLAQGRRTVTTCLRGAGITTDFGNCYYFLRSLGKRVSWCALSPMRVLVNRINPGHRWIFAIDDPPTQRYGCCVVGAGHHHNPTKGPTDQKYLFGHVWVTLA
ncbi:MAG: transposase [Gemmataceae bacterium]